MGPTGKRSLERSSRRQRDLSPKLVEMVQEVLGDSMIAVAIPLSKMAPDGANEAPKFAADTAMAVTNMKWEEDKCRRSILIHKADKWAGHIYKGFSLGENTTAQIHRLMGHTVLVLDAFSIGQWVDNKAPTTVFVTFGSVA